MRDEEDTGEIEVHKVGPSEPPRAFVPLAPLVPALPEPLPPPRPKSFFRDTLLLFDLNRDGIPDVRQPWFYRLGLQLILRALDKHPAPRALVEHLTRVVDVVERAAQDAEPKPPG